MESIKPVFQITSDEIENSSQIELFESPAFDEGRAKSFMFFAVQLKSKNYPRGKYAQFTREINKRIVMPVVVLFRVENRLTIGFVRRRPHKRKSKRNVLEQVTLIKDIALNNPHRAHLDILFELSLEECAKWMGTNNQPEDFDGLLAAWLARLDTEALNKQFYQKLFDWFKWAVDEAEFPTDEKRTLKPEEHVIRLITRLLFVWFMKEKGLVADALFTEAQVAPLLKAYDRANGDSYYRAVLQNLFFATLNTEIEKRQFSKGGNPGHRNFSRYRYKDQITDPDKLLELFARTPFINGGLFDCLDSEEATRDGGYRIDCFSDKAYKKLKIPNYLFFDKARGLIPLLEHYKFTVEESTPIEQEVALDPELLGKVFENLLAAYNPETGAAVRKQTGSYYTPRAIVDYMVDEALVATLAQQVSPTDDDKELWAEELHYLFDYAQECDDASEWFDDGETEQIVRTISELKILDPAVGSGAFPMGMLHKLTLALRRLDPDNNRWEELQKERAKQRADKAFDDTKDDEVRGEELLEINATFKKYRDSDFGRKLYLIQNSIFGLDIQSIACQIAKLRFFISLAIEQEADETADNFGIKPLPNLETRFVVANTLIGLKGEQTLTSQKTKALKQELDANRERHFHATTRSKKLACRTRHHKLRKELAQELKRIGMPADDAEKIALWDPYDQNATADWFDLERMFNITDGFDVVIGNPPYVRQEAIRPIKPQLAKEYGDFFTSTADLFVYFYKRSIDLMKSDGQLCFISSNKFFRAGYGLKLRQLLKTCRLRTVIDFGELPVFAAGTDPTIIQFQKAQPMKSHRLTSVAIKESSEIQHLPEAVKERGEILDQEHLEDSGWSVESGKTNALLLNKLRSKGMPLGEYVKGQFYMGIKTGLNEAFVVDGDTRNRLIAEHPSSAEVLKPFLRGRDVKQWRVDPQNLWLIFAHKGIQIDDYPAIKKHLEKYSGPLSKRAGSQEWYELQASPGDTDRFEQPKIIYCDIGTVLKAFYTEKHFYSGNTVYMMPVEALEVSLLAILLSKPIDWFVRSTFQSLGDPWKGGRLRFFVQSMVTIPIPPALDTDKARLSELAKSAAQAEGETLTAIETEINQIVYRLFNLTPEDIAILEGTSE